MRIKISPEHSDPEWLVDSKLLPDAKTSVMRAYCTGAVEFTDKIELSDKVLRAFIPHVMDEHEIQT